jgi:hypothetical protein
MIFKRRKDPAAAAELFIKNAQQHLGYTVDLGGRNIFGQKVGYDAQPWAGAFVDVVASGGARRIHPGWKLFTRGAARICCCL